VWRDSDTQANSERESAAYALLADELMLSQNHAFHNAFVTEQ
jgi:hypothetical protein